jgi:hypothetical protein
MGCAFGAGCPRPDKGGRIMKWYHYPMVFLGGCFVANFIPHFVEGVTGQAFPSPFADPPGQGLSPPAINVLWGLLNLVAGYLLLRYGNFSLRGPWPIVIMGFTGFMAFSLMLAGVFEPVGPR